VSKLSKSVDIHVGHNYSKTEYGQWHCKTRWILKSCPVKWHCIITVLKRIVDVVHFSVAVRVWNRRILASDACVMTKFVEAVSFVSLLFLYRVRLHVVYENWFRILDAYHESDFRVLRNVLLLGQYYSVHLYCVPIKMPRTVFHHYFHNHLEFWCQNLTWLLDKHCYLSVPRSLKMCFFICSFSVYLLNWHQYFSEIKICIL